MSIAPVGEANGSRSKCYYVIYDDHMVIKIPAKPIKSFSDYIRSIRYEGGIVKKLAPRECIIPTLSVIMIKYKLLSEVKNLPADALEDLAKLKKRSAHVTGLFSMVSNHSTQLLSVRNLLMLMFNIVSNAMHPDDLGVSQK